MKLLNILCWALFGFWSLAVVFVIFTYQTFNGERAMQILLCWTISVFGRALLSRQ